ncbi:MAG: HEPN domain-containing protein [Oligoflexia bacterium]|nr:HEPN domain-containing protein [Oligoflexia bacterium]
MSKEKKSNLEVYWKMGSDKDLSCASDLVNKVQHFSHALFFIHLSVEKALKYLYVKKHKKHAPLSHNLLFLAKECELAIEEESSKEISLASINEFNLESRYLEDVEELERRASFEFCTKYLKEAEELRQWIFSK